MLERGGTDCRRSGTTAKRRSFGEEIGLNDSPRSKDTSFIGCVGCGDEDPDVLGDASGGDTILVPVRDGGWKVGMGALHLGRHPQPAPTRSGGFFTRRAETRPTGRCGSPAPLPQLDPLTTPCLQEAFTSMNGVGLGLVVVAAAVRTAAAVAAAATNLGYTEPKPVCRSTRCSAAPLLTGVVVIGVGCSAATPTMWPALAGAGTAVVLVLMTRWVAPAAFCRTLPNGRGLVKALGRAARPNIATS